jgi:hypothetical protein
MEPEIAVSALRASDTDRDRTLEVLSDAIAVGRLTLDEHDLRAQAALKAVYVSDLSKLTVDLSLEVATPRRWNQAHRPAIIGVLALVVVMIVLIFALGRNNGPQIAISPGTGTATTTLGPSTAIASSAANSVPPSPASPAGDGLTIRTVPPGAFGTHDPADECGEFGTATTIGGNNCYVVIQFTNVSNGPVTFTPADLKMVDQTGDTYSLAPTLPVCFEEIDVNAPMVLQSNAQSSIQYCFPVMTGTLPQTMKGTLSLAGLFLTVPTSSIVGTWGGA